MSFDWWLRQLILTLVIEKYMLIVIFSVSVISHSLCFNNYCFIVFFLWSLGCAYFSLQSEVLLLVFSRGLVFGHELFYPFRNRDSFFSLSTMPYTFAEYINLCWRLWSHRSQWPWYACVWAFMLFKVSIETSSPVILLDPFYLWSFSWVSSWVTDFFNSVFILT